MTQTFRDYSRRDLLRLIGIAGGTIAAGTVAQLLAQSGMLPETPNLTLGPFYPLTKPLDQDADLTMIRGHHQRASGQVIHLTGRVLDHTGRPVRDARVEIWQANSFGRYAHHSDPNTSAVADPNFQGYGVQRTDSEGRYRFKTVKPAPYPAPEGDWIRAPHIHFDLQAKFDRKVTQMFFPGEPLNAQDRLLQGIRHHREALIASVSRVGADEWVVAWDITLASG